MADETCTEGDFIRLFETIGPSRMAEQLGITVSSIYQRRVGIEARIKRQLTPPEPSSGRRTRHNIQHASRLGFEVVNGTVIIGSDAHIWPGATTTAMRAFIAFCERLRPRVAILNGDVLDFPQISRHAPIGWERHPTVADEITAAQKILKQIEDAVPRNCKLAWSLGNHDGRFETRIATLAPELAKMKGVHLKDHFSERWTPCWSVWLNPDSNVPCVVKHRFKGGQGATRANTLNAGTSMVTGHLHSANVRALTDYKGTRWGVDTGCLADPSAEAFVHYTEDAPLDWRSGFAVLTFKDGVLLQPELALVFGRDTIEFRGEVIRV